MTREGFLRELILVTSILTYSLKRHFNFQKCMRLVCYVTINISFDPIDCNDVTANLDILLNISVARADNRRERKQETDIKTSDLTPIKTLNLVTN